MSVCCALWNVREINSLVKPILCFSFDEQYRQGTRVHYSSQEHLLPTFFKYRDQRTNLALKKRLYTNWCREVCYTASAQQVFVGRVALHSTSDVSFPSSPPPSLMPTIGS
jgi:hypothetical protein